MTIVYFSALAFVKLFSSFGRAGLCRRYDCRYYWTSRPWGHSAPWGYSQRLPGLLDFSQDLGGWTSLHFFAVLEKGVMEALGVILQDLQGVQRQGVPAAGPHEILYGLLRTSHTGQCERLG